MKRAVILFVFAALPAAADVRFRAAQMGRNDVPMGKGQCDIRLQVDDQVEVAVHGDMVSIRTLSGQEPRNDGSECNAPMPDRDIGGFNFEVMDSRNEIRLIEPPSRRNDFTAIVRIRDSSGGFGRYHFRLSWAMGPGGGGFDRPPETRDNPRDRPPDPRDNPRDRPPDFGRGGFAWNNVIHGGGPGRGFSSMSGIGRQRLLDANVDIDRGGRVQVSFRTDSGRPIMFVGTVIGREGDVLKADVSADERMLRVRGPMYISMDRDVVYRITLDASNGRDNLNVNWDRDRDRR